MRTSRFTEEQLAIALRQVEPENRWVPLYVISCFPSAKLGQFERVS
jgi:hypothetical protein